MKSISVICGWAILLAAVNTCANEPVFSGSWQQGSVLRGTVEPGSRVEFLGHEVFVADDGYFVVGLGRDAPETVALIVASKNGVATTHNYSVAQRDYKMQRIEGVPQKTVTPPPSYYERIRKEVKLAKTARAKRTQREDYRQAFEWPLLGPITGVYGSQRVYNGVPKRPHFGVDVAAPTGTKVRAPVSGIVTLAYDDMFFSGGTLIVDHGHGLSSTFIHLSKILVEQGQEVKQGDLIAEVGATGRVTGPHLDWRMNWFDQRVDPALLVPSMTEAQAKLKLKD
jgi:murein DD-endopeptidase MepM/ murein hydrolase activator NlpD